MFFRLIFLKGITDFAFTQRPLEHPELRLPFFRCFIVLHVKLRRVQKPLLFYLSEVSINYNEALTIKTSLVFHCNVAFSAVS